MRIEAKKERERQRKKEEIKRAACLFLQLRFQFSNGLLSAGLQPGLLGLEMGSLLAQSFLEVFLAARAGAQTLLKCSASGLELFSFLRDGLQFLARVTRL
jgi:hypothetical protein